jgi:uncharacterized protein
MKIVIPGGNGQVGHILARHFHQKGHDVTVLSRAPKTAPWRLIEWDGTKRGAWLDTIEGSDVLINLAGRSVTAATTAKTAAPSSNRAFVPRRYYTRLSHASDVPPRFG